MPDTVRVGAVDCGTNSIRLLVADVTPESGALVDVVRRMEIVRLGYGVDRTGRIDSAAMSRTLAAAADYAAQCRTLDAVDVRFVATSASRDAANAADFVAGVRAAFADEGYDTSPEVITGAEEAGLSFSGATGDLRAAGVPAPYLVVDLGGGSTEFVRGGDTVESARSVDIGCVRLTERHLGSDPPTRPEIEAALADIDAAIAQAREVVPFEGARSLVGLAGTVTTVTAQVLGLREYDASRLHLATTSPSDTRRAAAELLAMTRAERAALGFMHPGRVDVIGSGALIWGRIIETVQAATGLGEDLTVVTSEHDILDGIALGVAARMRADDRYSGRPHQNPDISDTRDQ